MNADQNQTTDIIAELRSANGWKGSPSCRYILDRAADEILRLRLEKRLLLGQTTRLGRFGRLVKDANHD